jgi:hypothetical protein
MYAHLLFVVVDVCTKHLAEVRNAFHGGDGRSNPAVANYMVAGKFAIIDVRRARLGLPV